MGGISGLFGGGGGASGSGFAAPAGTNPQDLNSAQAAITNNATQQQAFVNQLNAQGGLGNQSAVFQQQQALANQLQGVANGTGPNPALAQLAQTTGQNVAQQGALQAGQRGSSANTGLMARNIAQQGGQLQQGAAGQAATLAAQQQLAGMQQLQNQQASMGNLANTQVGQQQAGIQNLNQNALQNQANLFGMQANMNTANAGLARQSQINQTTAGQGAMGMLGKLPGLMGGGGGGANGEVPTGDGSQVIDSGNAASGFDNSGGTLLDASGGTGDIAGAMMGAKGGMIRKMADGGDPLEQPIQNKEVAPVQVQQQSGPQSGMGQFLKAQNAKDETAFENQPDSSSKGSSDPMSSMSSMMGPAIQGVQKYGGQGLQAVGDFFGGKSGSAAGETGQGFGDFFSGMGSGMTMAGGAGDAGAATTAGEGIGAGIDTAVMVAAKGGKVPAMVSPGEQYLPPKDVKKVAKGANPLAVGERIPGKPKYKGNNYANDIVPKTLEAGGIVIPNKIMQSKNPHWEAMKFVHATMAKNRGKKNG